MRKHLYKAKCVNWRELPKEEWWVYGMPVEHGGCLWMYTGEINIIELARDIYKNTYSEAVKYEVTPETVCQYTGLTDKNGRKIFEGDILSFSAYGENYKGDVRFIKGNFAIWCVKCAPFLDDALEKHSAIVIGNIFDNPEILKGGETG